LPVAASAQRPSFDHVIWREIAFDQQLAGSPRSVRYTLESVPSRATFLVDSTVWVDGRREVFGERARLVVDSTGALLEYLPSPTSLSPSNVRVSLMGLAHHAIGVYFREAQDAAVYRALPSPLRVGQTVIEAVAWARDSIGVGVSEQGVRTISVLRDTLIDGRVHWLLRDSMTVLRSERWPEFSYLWPNGLYAMERQGPRVRVGRSIYDPDRQLTVLRIDSVRWDLDLRQTQPDGTTAVTRQRVTGVEKWEVLSSAQYQLRREQLANARGGMVRVPTTPLQRRLSEGDPAALDSALALWLQVPNGIGTPTGETDLMWWRGDPWQPRAFEEALARQDTIAALRVAESLLRPPLDSAALAFVLGIVAHPERALAWSLPVDYGLTGWYYEVMRLPPGVTPPEQAACRPAVCEMLAAYADSTEVDARLRDVGYALRFILDPRGQYDSLVARAAVGTGVAATFVRVAQGYPLQWSNPERGSPAPETSAWQDWFAWMDGERAAIDGAALQLYLRRTGRDLRSEALEGFRAATNETALFTYGVLIASLAPDAITVEETVALHDDGGSLRNQLAGFWRGVLFRSAALAPDSVAAPLLSAVLDRFLNGVSPSWEGLDAEVLPVVGTDAVLLSDDTPAPVLQGASGRLPVVGRAEWQDRRPPLANSAIFLGTPTVAGPFVRLNVRIDRRQLRGEQFSYSARFATITLLRTATGWRVVEAVGAVT
jgi:hypothetical protein